MSCRVSKGRRTTNGRRSLKLRLFGFKQSCFPQAVKKEIELGYNVFCAGGIVNSCCRCDGSRRTSRALRTGLAPWTFWALGALWAGCSLWTCCSHLTLWSLRPSCSRFTYRTLWPLRSCSSCLSCRPLGTGLPGGSCLTLGPRVSGKSLWSPWSWRSHWTRSACATTAWSPWIRSPSAWPTTIRTAISGASAARSTVSASAPIRSTTAGTSSKFIPSVKIIKTHIQAPFQFHFHPSSVSVKTDALFSFVTIEYVQGVFFVSILAKQPFPVIYDPVYNISINAAIRVSICPLSAVE